MSALVSVIIPVYNLEKHISHCIESMLAQTYGNIEIICVDDGSADSSAQIIGEICRSDSRVKYVFQENAGVSAARNKGLETAKGDYIIFVDGDDYMHPRAVEILLSCIENSDCRIVCAPEFKTDKIDVIPENIEDFVCEETDHEGLFSYKYGSVLGKSVWSKIFEAGLAKSVRFNENYANGEDANYMVRILTRDKDIKVGVVDRKLYYYYTHENSFVASEFTESKFSITLSFEDLCEYLKETEYSFLKAYCLQYLYQTVFYNRTNAIGTPAQKYVLRESKRIGKKWLDDFRHNEDIDANIRKMFVLFFKSRHLYELARMVKDPTMLTFYFTRFFKRFKRKD